MRKSSHDQSAGREEYGDKYNTAAKRYDVYRTDKSKWKQMDGRIHEDP